MHLCSGIKQRAPILFTKTYKGQEHVNRRVNNRMNIIVMTTHCLTNSIHACCSTIIVFVIHVHNVIHVHWLSVVFLKRWKYTCFRSKKWWHIEEFYAIQSSKKKIDQKKNFTTFFSIILRWLSKLTFPIQPIKIKNKKGPNGNRTDVFIYLYID